MDRMNLVMDWRLLKKEQDDRGIHCIRFKPFIIFSSFIINSSPEYTQSAQCASPCTLNNKDSNPMHCYYVPLSDTSTFFFFFFFFDLQFFF